MVPIPWRVLSCFSFFFFFFLARPFLIIAFHGCVASAEQLTLLYDVMYCSHIAPTTATHEWERPNKTALQKSEDGWITLDEASLLW